MADDNLQRGWKGSVAHRRIGELVEDEQHVFIGLLVQTVRDEVEGILPERECGQCGRHAEETVYGSREVPQIGHRGLLPGGEVQGPFPFGEFVQQGGLPIRRRPYSAIIWNPSRCHMRSSTSSSCVRPTNSVMAGAFPARDSIKILVSIILTSILMIQNCVSSTIFPLMVLGIIASFRNTTAPYLPNTLPKSCGRSP